jgi:D-alanine-D-alanine ligase
MPRRIKVAVIYGGRSSEHDVSLQSARCVLDNLDTDRFELIPLAIDRDGSWHRQDLARLQAHPGKALPIETGKHGALPAETGVSTVSDSVTAPALRGGASLAGTLDAPIDVVFPVMHGPLCEDGSLQGMLELSDVAYVGAGVLGSAVCMDKDVAKRLVRAAGLETAEYFALQAGRYEAAALDARVQRELRYPVFVKPATLGSSVGVSRARDAAELQASVELAFEYDTKLLVERAVDAREIELAVLQSLTPGASPDVSVAGEITPDDAFYSYERKYLESAGARLRIPAELSAEQARDAQRIAAVAFEALECEGMARIDLFLDRKSGQLLFNEANTIPGFTTISMYPKLWEASGLGYRALLSRLIDLALARHARKQQLKRER